MAVKKATTVADLTASAVDPSPTRDDLEAGVVESTSPDMLADVKAPKYVKVTSPAGTTTEVPESLVDVLVESGYSKGK